MDLDENANFINALSWQNFYSPMTRQGGHYVPSIIAVDSVHCIKVTDEKIRCLKPAELTVTFKFTVGQIFIPL